MVTLLVCFGVAVGGVLTIVLLRTVAKNKAANGCVGAFLALGLIGQLLMGSTPQTVRFDGAGYEVTFPFRAMAESLADGEVVHETEIDGEEWYAAGCFPKHHADDPDPMIARLVLEGVAHMLIARAHDGHSEGQCATEIRHGDLAGVELRGTARGIDRPVPVSARVLRSKDHVIYLVTMARKRVDADKFFESLRPIAKR